ncbi:unnamed protein product [Durusdinium trenchii]|uniref:Uncharacterized protein n=2 Tax=Durusdinium trenchii TaxID=1381693 RepID=A0ABP0MJ04_9DINO
MARVIFIILAALSGTECVWGHKARLAGGPVALAPAPAPMPVVPRPEPRLMPSLADGRWTFVDGDAGVRSQSYENSMWFYAQRQAAQATAGAEGAEAEQALAALTKSAALEMLMPTLTEGQWKYLNPDGSVRIAGAEPILSSFAPASAPSSAAAPAPAAAPAAALSAQCSGLAKAADFLKCKDVRVMSSESFGGAGLAQLDAVGQLLGCHCGVWAETCPMQSCPTVSHAWEGPSCLEAGATDLGFVGLSHSRQELPKVAAPDHDFAQGSISLCMYWLPDPLPHLEEPKAPGLTPAPAPAR